MGRPKQCEILQHKGICTDVVYAVSSHDNDRAHEHYAHIERLKALAPSLMCELAYIKMACAMAFPKCERDGNVITKPCRNELLEIFEKCPGAEGALKEIGADYTKLTATDQCFNVEFYLASPNQKDEDEDVEVDRREDAEDADDAEDVDETEEAEDEEAEEAQDAEADEVETEAEVESENEAEVESEDEAEVELERRQFDVEEAEVEANEAEVELERRQFEAEEAEAAEVESEEAEVELAERGFDESELENLEVEFELNAEEAEAESAEEEAAEANVEAADA
ncbi:hypothetical protein HDU96_003162 [Phlyctochytrium bullatum]|nr:hypothetical protein HDU96_003162 [Phlyctochytrium bullatum]